MTLTTEEVTTADVVAMRAVLGNFAMSSSYRELNRTYRSRRRRAALPKVLFKELTGAPLPKLINLEDQDAERPNTAQLTLARLVHNWLELYSVIQIQNFLKRNNTSSVLDELRRAAHGDAKCAARLTEALAHQN
jgi:fumarylacetoacetate (FAA) hydrolase family protein